MQSNTEQKINKSYDANSNLEVNEGKREVVAIISTDNIDRDGEVVSPKGMKKKAYAGNPIVLVNHDAQSLPVAKALWVKSEDNRIIAKYVVSDKTQLARDVFGLLQDGTLSAHSIGFISNPDKRSAPSATELKKYPYWSGAKAVHRDWELFEFSIVGIPANPEALALAVSKGHCSAETLKLLFPDKEGTEEEQSEQAKQEVTAFVPSENDIKRAFFETLLKRLKSAR